MWGRRKENKKGKEREKVEGVELRKEGRQTFWVWGRKDKREKGEGEDEEKYDNEGGMKQGWNGEKGGKK